ncbi:hypothetical protein FACS1894142_8660 [Spirochaetia bacterium]|nr:hypothetical protein FACS1894142_8660 [Spirochaetia bacterium]
MLIVGLCVLFTVIGIILGMILITGIYVKNDNAYYRLGYTRSKAEIPEAKLKDYIL